MTDDAATDIAILALTFCGGAFVGFMLAMAIDAVRGTKHKRDLARAYLDELAMQKPLGAPRYIRVVNDELYELIRAQSIAAMKAGEARKAEK